MGDKMKKFFVLFFAAAVIAIFSNNSYAAIIDVSYSYSGTEGNYLLDFKVTNNMPVQTGENSGQYLYFFGVDMAYDASQGIPTGWEDWTDGNGGHTWNNFSYGGSDTDYPTTWFTDYFFDKGIAPGGSLSGFTVHSSFLPDTIHYYAYTAGFPEYYGDDAFYKGWNPGFEGLVGPGQTTVPEPATAALFGIGGIVAAYFRKKKSI